MKNMGELQRLAQRMQAEMQKAQQELAQATVEGTAGGGAVTVVMTGSQEVRTVRIDPEAAGDAEMLSDLVLAAVADALRKSKELAAQRLGGLTGGLNIPGIG
jgi:DNA-binding YbaB/EbfC family protein